MRDFCVFVVLALVAVQGWAADPAGSHREDIYIVRGGEQLQSPHVVTYHVVEWIELRGRWIAPDLGYYDNGYGKDQIWFAAAGAEMVRRPRFEWSQEIYLTQEAGPEAHNQRSVWIWPVFDARLWKKLSTEVVPYPTIPLNKAQRWGLNVDRAKLEWTANGRWRGGVGYSGGIGSDRTWQSMPFVTATRTTRAGSFECWIERMPGGAQVQLRYMLVRGGE